MIIKRFSKPKVVECSVCHNEITHYYQDKTDQSIYCDSCNEEYLTKKLLENAPLSEVYDRLIYFSHSNKTLCLNNNRAKRLIIKAAISFPDPRNPFEEYTPVNISLENLHGKPHFVYNDSTFYAKLLAVVNDAAYLYAGYSIDNSLFKVTIDESCGGSSAIAYSVLMFNIKLVDTSQDSKDTK